VPVGGLFLTAGADVQADRIEVQVVAWGRGKESWLVDYQIINGDTARLDSPAWVGLAEVLNRPYQHESGAAMNLQMLGVDSGFQTQTVYAWARQQGPARVLAIKGQENGVALLGMPTSADVTRAGKRTRRGIRVWPMNVSMAKSELYGWLRQERPSEGEPFPPGWCHFPQMPIEFFRSLTAEQYVFRVHKGFRRGEWVKVRERNEALDTRNYARGAAERVGLSRMTEADFVKLERELGLRLAPEPKTQPRQEQVQQVQPMAANVPPPAPDKPRRQSWLGNRGGGWFSR
jgi:phage terminase large subunit GpA-like protein